MKWWWTSILLIRARFVPTGSRAEVADEVVGDAVDSSPGDSLVSSWVLFNPDSVVDEDSPRLWTVFGTTVTWSSWAPSIAISFPSGQTNCRWERKGRWWWSWNGGNRLSSSVDWWWSWTIDDIKYYSFPSRDIREFDRFIGFFFALRLPVSRRWSNLDDSICSPLSMNQPVSLTQTNKK